MYLLTLIYESLNNGNENTPSKIMFSNTITTMSHVQHTRHRYILHQCMIHSPLYMTDHFVNPMTQSHTDPGLLRANQTE